MNTLTGIIIFTSMGGLLSIVAAGTLLSLPNTTRNSLVPHLVSFATGALLGAAFLGLLPHALEEMTPDKYHALGLSILVGILTFFILEKTVLWRHCHNDHCAAHAIGVDTHQHDDHGDYHDHGHNHQHDHFQVSDEQREAASGKMILVGDAL